VIVDKVPLEEEPMTAEENLEKPELT